jgi:hypothetical protein
MQTIIQRNARVIHLQVERVIQLTELMKNRANIILRISYRMLLQAKRFIMFGDQMENHTVQSQFVELANHLLGIQ